MVDADEWSRAISEWVTERGQGETVYLCVTPEDLDALAEDRWDMQNGFQSFCRAVRIQVQAPDVDDWTKAPDFNVPSSRSLPRGGPPECTAFLAYMVVCAGLYGEVAPGYRGTHNGVYYFPWFRHFLGGHPLSSRAGMGRFDDTLGGAPESRLWRDWGKYLEKKGFGAVPEANDGGALRYVGQALAQAILTTVDRRYLRGPNCPRAALRRALVRGEAARRFVEVSLPGGSDRLRRLVNDRASDTRVREAIRDALDGVPAGPRPRAARFRLVRHRIGEYELRLNPPQGWRGVPIAFGSASCRTAVPLRPNQLRTTNVDFKLTNAVETVRWETRDAYVFLQPQTRLGAWEEGQPRLGEEHIVLARRSEARALEDARAKNECEWERAQEIEGWTEYSGFRLRTARVALETALLSTDIEDGLAFEGGVLCGEPRDGATRLLAEARGGVRATERTGVASVGSWTLDLATDLATPLPADLTQGEYRLTFGERSRRFELVSWRQIVADLGEASPGDWLEGRS